MNFSGNNSEIYTICLKIFQIVDEEIILFQTIMQSTQRICFLFSKLYVKKIYVENEVLSQKGCR